MPVASMLVEHIQSGISLGPLVILIVVGWVILMYSSQRKRRSRYIPVRSRRLAQAKLFQKHYSDPKTAKQRLRLKDYEHDHMQFFADGGSSEPENIELITRKENRRKGRKSR